ncbi:hypothetical protein N7474_006345 [Penicillium riverlandense]|uniref:uncharacterized protein n=1 Tax=Penicillium riverlandense TaxID=1903569 RepID=UPI002549546F|nr:uncharacterized protein N7474_006345 [Penicillium riverlandense]KAJ5814568.1 hypothetical protein N7474_006345 [Penicillium riverlandense]
MRLSFFLGLATFAAPSMTLPTDLVVHGSVPPAASSWVQGEPATAETKLSMQIGITQRNLERAAEFLDDVSNPASANYGKYWDADKIVRTFAPSQSTVDKVKSWLTQSGIAADRISLTQSGGWLSLDISVAEAENLLGTKYHVFTHPKLGNQIACESYSVPAHLASYIDVITPTVHLTPMLPYTLHFDGFQPVEAASHGDCSSRITLECLRSLYGIPQHPEASAHNSYGIPEMDGESMNSTDLKLFLRKYRPEAANDQLIAKLINGGKYPSNPDPLGEMEAALDLEYATGLTYPVKTTLYQVGGMINSNQKLWDILDSALCDSGRTCSKGTCIKCAGLTNVISISYGTDEDMFAPTFAKRQCHEYMKMGLQGTSVLYASGDSGVASRHGCGTSGTSFTPQFPASCPYITSVGATMLKPGASTDQPEVAAWQAVYGFSSGGGFSNTFSMPGYQQQTVSSWLSKHKGLYGPKIFNNSGNSRAYPDVSANGKNFVVVVGGQEVAVSGTSASSPTFGSVLTLINSVLINSGKPKIGFANTFIYQHPEIFNDITSGNNSDCHKKGFSAEKGWDPVTGFGTPNYHKMLNAWMKAS